MDGVAQVEMLDDRGGVGGVVVHVVAVADLARTAVAAPVVGDDAIALADEEEHLGVPVVGTQRPAVMEHDRLRVLGAPVLEVDLGPVFGGDRAHRTFSFPYQCLNSGLWILFSLKVETFLQASFLC